MPRRINGPENSDSIPSKNPVRERLISRETADFSSATLRRIALFHQGRK